MPPTPETETRLAELGCPYEATDPRAVPWLNGYQAGYKKATDQAIAAINRLVQRLFP